MFGAFVQVVCESFAMVAGDGVFPDALVGADVDHVPIEGDQLHDGWGWGEKDAEEFVGVIDAFFGIRIAVSPAQGHVFWVSEIGRWDEAGFHQPGVGEDHACVKVVSDHPNIDMGGMGRGGGILGRSSCGGGGREGLGQLLGQIEGMSRQSQAA